jgi:hypothetical protein
MGIIFDGKKYKDKSNNYEFESEEEMSRLRGILIEALEEEGRDDKKRGYEYNQTKKAIVINLENKRYTSSGENLKTLKFKGFFQGLNPSKEKTWKNTVIEKINYEGKDGIIKVGAVDPKGSLGSIHKWKNAYNFDKYIFKGDDIIHGSKSEVSVLRGYDGNDTIFHYAEGGAVGGKGKDKFIVTKDGFESIVSKRPRDSIRIEDASSVQGDSVEVAGSISAFTRVAIFRDEKAVYYDPEDNNYGINIYWTNQPVYADFV